MFRIAIDTGGTFTDYISVDETGRSEMVKNPTNHTDPAAGIIAGLHQLAAQGGLDLKEFLSRTGQITHGTTLALNALLERKGAKTALLTTAGFRDALEIRRSRRNDQWDLRAQVPPVLVPRSLRLGVKERVDYSGKVVTPLDRESLAAVTAELARHQVESVAISFLFSFVNPTHEQQAAAYIREHLPGVPVYASSDIAPRIREFERTSTTVLNAYLTPVLAGYLARLEAALKEYGWAQPLHIMLNSGGLTDSWAVKNAAVKTLLSGPAGGARGGELLAGILERPNLVVADMGGTSFDVALVAGGSSQVASEAEIAGYPVSLPVIDIRSIGAGGGSIAFVDNSGRLNVGPRSAGSIPGPACYGLGGSEPTVTDAALVLGFLKPETFLGGRHPLDLQKARQVIEDQVAVPLGLPIDEAALAIYRIAGAKMADAVRLVTVQQGLDPRQFTLVAAGGAFPLFAAEIAEELDISEVIVPIQGPVFCAWGMLGATCRCNLVQTCLIPQSSWDPAYLSGLIGELQRQAETEFDRLKVPAESREFYVNLEMKYEDQHHEISVPMDEMSADEAGLQKINEAFHRRHQELYGYAEPDKPWVIVDLHFTGREKNRPVSLPALSEQETDIITGPALIVFPYTTVRIPQGFSGTVAPKGYISVQRGETD